MERKANQTQKKALDLWGSNVITQILLGSSPEIVIILS